MRRRLRRGSAGAVVMMPLPHALRPREYGSADVPWTYDAQSGALDRFGASQVPAVKDGGGRGGGGRGRGRGRH
jgi:hypothetical protein